MPISNPVCSTDSIWREEDVNRSLSHDLNNIESDLASIFENKADATHTHNTFIQSLNTSFNVTASNGSFSVTPSVEFIDGGTYLINLQYATNSGLVDRSTYAFRYDTSKVIQSTTILANCYNGNDNFMASYRNGTLTFASSYTGTGIPTKMTVKII